MNTSGHYLEFCHIGQTFPGVKALQDISFGCSEGSVHALMGENGAGKSTLLRILSGNYVPTTGVMHIDGKPVHFNSATDALHSGIAIIYQELHLVPEITVAENIYLGQLPHRFGVVDRQRLREMAQVQLQHLGVDIDPDTPLKYLSIGQWQMVEIAKALTRQAKIIAFDEPTSSLSAREITQLFRVIRELKADGRIIIYVSHRMEEILDLCDCVTVFKDGCFVKTFSDTKAITHEQLIHAMVGRDVGDLYGYATRLHGDVRLKVSELVGHGVRKPISLDVRQGEIVGLFGLVGAGRTELMKVIFGGERPLRGEVCVDGQHLNIQHPIDAIKNGIVLCPEDRKAEGIIPGHSVRDNINISARRKYLHSGLINPGWEKKNADKMIKQLDIKTPSPEQLIMKLSGGNQQKAILGRWLSEAEDMKVILLDEPTRGIDVGAKHEIYSVIFDLAKTGVSVLFSSRDLPEVLGLADRVIVMRDGEISGELQHDQATEEQVLKLAMPL